MNDLGDVYYKQKILTSSILSYEKTVGIIQKLNMKEALGPVYNKLGVAHYEMGNYAEAEKFFKESLKNLNENGNRKEASMALNNLGNLLFINNKYSDAISYYERSLDFKEIRKLFITARLLPCLTWEMLTGDQAIRKWPSKIMKTAKELPTA